MGDFGGILIVKKSFEGHLDISRGEKTVNTSVFMPHRRRRRSHKQKPLNFHISTWSANNNSPLPLGRLMKDKLGPAIVYGGFRWPETRKRINY